MIKDWFCVEGGKDAVNHFYKLVLFKHFVKGEDYKEIGRDDPLVRFYEEKYSELCSPNQVSNKHNTKYYMVTGECFQITKDLKTYKYYLAYIK